MNISSKLPPITAALLALMMITSAPAIAADQGMTNEQEQAKSGFTAQQPATSDTPEQQQSEESYGDSYSPDGCPFNREEHEKPLTG